MDSDSVSLLAGAPTLRRAGLSGAAAARITTRQHGRFTARLRRPATRPNRREDFVGTQTRCRCQRHRQWADSSDRQPEFGVVARVPAGPKSARVGPVGLPGLAADELPRGPAGIFRLRRRTPEHDLLDPL